MKTHSTNVKRCGHQVVGRKAVEFSSEKVSRANSGVGDDTGSVLPREFDAFFACQRAVAGLVSQRAKAYFDWCYAFSRCESPREVVEEQTRFFDDASAQYEDCSRQVISAFVGCFDSSIGCRSHSNGRGLEDRVDARTRKCRNVVAKDRVLARVDAGVDDRVRKPREIRNAQRSRSVRLH